MNNDIIILAQSFIDVLTWFIIPFALMVALTWVASFFRR